MKNSLIKAFMSLLFFCLMTLNLLQAQPYQPTAENLKNREWFENAKFGLFIHWGVYSVLGDGEWVMNQQQIPIKIYEKIPSFFNPTDFDPKAWVQMAKAAGMKYNYNHKQTSRWFCHVGQRRFRDYNISKNERPREKTF